jgi:hypothetical protein
MVVPQCPVCGSELSPGGVSCPRCERPVRAPAAATVAPRRRLGALVATGILLILVGIGVCFMATGVGVFVIIVGVGLGVAGHLM